jgi:hypothetical protein
MTCFSRLYSDLPLPTDQEPMSMDIGLHIPGLHKTIRIVGIIPRVSKVGRLVLESPPRRQQQTWWPELIKDKRVYHESNGNMLTVVHLQPWWERGYSLKRPESELRQRMFDIMISHCLGKPVPLPSDVLQNICSQFSVIRSHLTKQSPNIFNPDAKILAMSFWYEVSSRSTNSIHARHASNYVKQTSKRA